MDGTTPSPAENYGTVPSQKQAVGRHKLGDCGSRIAHRACEQEAQSTINLRYPLYVEVVTQIDSEPILFFNRSPDPKRPGRPYAHRCWVTRNEWRQTADSPTIDATFPCSDRACRTPLDVLAKHCGVSPLPQLCDRNSGFHQPCAWRSRGDRNDRRPHLSSWCLSHTGLESPNPSWRPASGCPSRTKLCVSSTWNLRTSAS